MVKSEEGDEGMSKYAASIESIRMITQYGVDVTTAALLLTRQITTNGIFLVPGGFYLAATGPVLGGVRSIGVDLPYTAVLRAVDGLLAILLILQVIRVTGPYITTQRFFVVFSGPIFGIKEIAGTMDLRDMTRPSVKGIREFVKQTLVDSSQERKN